MGTNLGSERRNGNGADDVDRTGTEGALPGVVYKEILSKIINTKKSKDGGT